SSHSLLRCSLQLTFFTPPLSTIELHSLSLHDALPISLSAAHQLGVYTNTPGCGICDYANADITVTFTVNSTTAGIVTITPASVTPEEHTSELESPSDRVCRRLRAKNITASATSFASPT